MPNGKDEMTKMTNYHSFRESPCLREQSQRQLTALSRAFEFWSPKFIAVTTLPRSLCEYIADKKWGQPLSLPYRKTNTVFLQHRSKIWISEIARNKIPRTILSEISFQVPHDSQHSHERCVPVKFQVCPPMTIYQMSFNANSKTLFFRANQYNEKRI